MDHNNTGIDMAIKGDNTTSEHKEEVDYCAKYKPNSKFNPWRDILVHCDFIMVTLETKQDHVWLG